MFCGFSPREDDADAAHLLELQELSGSKVKDSLAHLEQSKLSAWVSTRVVEFSDGLNGRAIKENHLRIVAQATRKDLLDASHARAAPDLNACQAHVYLMALAVINAVYAGSGYDSAVKASAFFQLPAQTLRACLGISRVLGGLGNEDKGVRVLATVSLPDALSKVDDFCFAVGWWVAISANTPSRAKQQQKT